MTLSSSDPAGKSLTPDPNPASEKNLVPGAAAAPAKTPVAAVGDTAPAEISLQDFQRVCLRTGKIVAAEIHPQADRLLVLKVDIGESEPRQVVAGIRSAYQPADLIGKTVVVVANLKPAVLRGAESRGMVLAASDAAGIVLLSPERAVTPGSTVK